MTTFKPPPLAVLPGDDLTHYILHQRPPANKNSTSSSSSITKPKKSPSRKNKKSKTGATARDDRGDNSSDESDGIDDGGALSSTVQRSPPKMGSGLICITQQNPLTNENELRIQAIIAGRLVYRPSSRTWFVASNPRRYHLSSSGPIVPIKLSADCNNGDKSRNNRIMNSTASLSNMGVGDRVIGIIEDQKASSDYYRVNIFGSHSALLHILSFEGATKRNRPFLEPGSLIYCRIIRGFSCGKVDPEVSCKVGGAGGAVSGYSKSNSSLIGDDGGASRKDFLTDEGTYGLLQGGTSARVSLGLARELLRPSNVLLQELDKSGIPFEICIGANGVVWVHSSEPEYTIMIMNAIKNSEVLKQSECRGMVRELVKMVKRQLEDD